MALPCGLFIGDKVICSNGESATVLGRPARKACSTFSVCVRYDSSGILQDERASDLIFQVDADMGPKPNMRENKPDDLTPPVQQQQVSTLVPEPKEPSPQQQGLPSHFFKTGSFANVRKGRSSMNPKDKAICVRITHFLNQRDVLKREVHRCFDEVDVEQRGVLSIQGLIELCGKLEKVTLVPTGAFGSFPDTYSRFDFNGDGTLDKNEAYKCVKYCLKAYRKARDGQPVPDVPYVAGGPTQLGYQLIKVLASGGQGTAALVQNSQGKEFVQKSYDKANANAGGIDELRDEMEAMQSMAKCPQIASSVEVFQDSKKFYLISFMNYGGDWVTLKDRAVGQGVSLTEQWYKSIFGQTFVGLEHMHRNAMMHCDIKEQNLMIRNRDLSCPEVVIIDLGLAHAIFDEGGVFGTPGYIPPETWTTAKWFPKGDVFSMGVVCFQMLTGEYGLFVNGARTMEDVDYFTQNRQPRFGKIGSNRAIMEWLPRTLEKTREARLKSRQVLDMQWFAERETWLPNTIQSEPNDGTLDGLVEQAMDCKDEENSFPIKEQLEVVETASAPTASPQAMKEPAQPSAKPNLPVQRVSGLRHTFDERLAGGFYPGDLVFCTSQNKLATVVGPPSRKACMAISVAVRYDSNGAFGDERVATLELQSS